MAAEVYTVERIERAMDRLAACIANLGDDGLVFLPIYRRLERELTDRKNAEETLRSVLDRVKRSRDQTAKQSA